MRLPTSFTAARKLALPLASMVVSGAAILNLSSDAGPAALLQAAAPSCTLTVPSRIAISSPRPNLPSPSAQIAPQPGLSTPGGTRNAPMGC
jgi:hypothetical protein